MNTIFCNCLGTSVTRKREKLSKKTGGGGVASQEDAQCFNSISEPSFLEVFTSFSLFFQVFPGASRAVPNRSRPISAQVKHATITRSTTQPQASGQQASGLSVTSARVVSYDMFCCLTRNYFGFDCVPK